MAAAARQIAAQLSAFDLKIEVEALAWEDYTAALDAGEFAAFRREYSERLAVRI